MKLLVTGAAGLIGSHLTELALERGDVVRAMVRAGEQVSWLAKAGAEVRRADMADRASLQAAVDGVDCVLHCAARMGPWGPEAEYELVNVRGPKILVEAAMAAGVERFVHVSTIDVHGLAVGEGVDEAAPYGNERDPYCRSKTRGERAIRHLIEDRGAPVTIVRPGLTYGPRDTRSFGRFAGLIEQRKMVIIGPGDNHVPLIYVTDVARGILLASEAAEATGNVYLLVNDQKVTQRDYFNAIAAELGVPPPAWHVSSRLALALGATGELAGHVTRMKRPPPLVRFGVKQMGGENRFVISRARRELGFSPQVDLAEGVRKSVTWWYSRQTCARSIGNQKRRLNVEILITGGNGFIGRHLIPALQERGHHVRVLASPKGDTTWLEKHDVAIFRGDVRIPEMVLAPMRGADAVFNLAAESRVLGPMRDSYAVNVTGTQNVCRAAVATDVHRLVHISTFSIYKTVPGRPVTEDDPLAPLNVSYSVTKAEGDKVVQRMIAGDRLRAVILRPGAFLGPGDHRNFGRLADHVRAGRGIIIGAGNNAVPFVYVTDVIQALLLAMDSERAVGQIYNIGNDHPLTQEGYLEAIAQELGVKPPRIHVPYQPLYAAAYAAERITTWSGYRVPPVITRYGIKIFAHDNRISIDKARRDLGYAPQVPVREGVKLTATWYRQSGTRLA